MSESQRDRGAQLSGKRMEPMHLGVVPVPGTKVKMAVLMQLVVERQIKGAGVPAPSLSLRAQA